MRVKDTRFHPYSKVRNVTPCHCGHNRKLPRRDSEPLEMSDVKLPVPSVKGIPIMGATFGAYGPSGGWQSGYGTPFTYGTYGTYNPTAIPISTNTGGAATIPVGTIGDDVVKTAKAQLGFTFDELGKKFSGSVLQEAVAETIKRWAVDLIKSKRNEKPGDEDFWSTVGLLSTISEATIGTLLSGLGPIAPLIGKGVGVLMEGLGNLADDFVKGEIKGMYGEGEDCSKALDPFKCKYRLERINADTCDSRLPFYEECVKRKLQKEAEDDIREAKNLPKQTIADKTYSGTPIGGGTWLGERGEDKKEKDPGPEPQPGPSPDGGKGPIVITTVPNVPKGGVENRVPPKEEKKEEKKEELPDYGECSVVTKDEVIKLLGLPSFGLPPAAYQ